MRKALRNKELTMIIFRQFHRHMLTVCRRTLTDIHGNIQHPTLHASHQLALGKRRSLEMQATHHTITAHALVVLAELYLVAYQRLHFLFKLTLAGISPIQRPHYITSSYTYQFFEKNIFCIVLRVKDC